MAGSSWTNQVVASVIVGGTGPGTGVFVYDPTVTLGDLIASITDATTGPEGETTAKGINAYVTFAGDVMAVGLNLTLGGSGLPGLSVTDITNPPTTPAGVGAQAVGTGGISPGGDAFLISGQGTLADVAASVVVESQLTSGVTNGTVALNGGQTTVGGALIATAGTAANPSNITTDTWHDIATAGFLNGWANTAGNVKAQYRMVASPPKSVEIIGAILATGASAVTFFQLPAGPPSYRPASQQQVVAAGTGGVAAGTSCFIGCDTSGNLTVHNGTIGAANSYLFHGFISLDA